MTDDSATLRAMAIELRRVWWGPQVAPNDDDTPSDAWKRVAKYVLASQSPRAKEKEELQTALGKCAIELGILQHDKAGLERQLAAYQDALESYACAGDPDKCGVPKLKNGQCVREHSSACGKEAYEALLKAQEQRRLLGDPRVRVEVPTGASRSETEKD